MATIKEIEDFERFINKINERNRRRPIIEHTLRMCERNIAIIDEDNGNVQYALEERPITRDDILIEERCND